MLIFFAATYTRSNRSWVPILVLVYTTAFLILLALVLTYGHAPLSAGAIGALAIYVVLIAAAGAALVDR